LTAGAAAWQLSDPSDSDQNIDRMSPTTLLRQAVQESLAT
jgi:hypothetical protein